MYEQADGYAIVALVFGILSVIGIRANESLPFILTYVYPIFGILGIVFGIKTRSVCSKNRRGLATAGIILGSIGLVYFLLMIISVAAYKSTYTTIGSLVSL